MNNIIVLLYKLFGFIPLTSNNKTFSIIFTHFVRNILHGKTFLNTLFFLLYMEGTIVNFRRNSTGQRTNHLIITVKDVDNKEKASKLVGKKVTYNTGKKDMIGKVNAIHGNKGAVRAVFETGLPGQCLGKKVKVDKIETFLY